MCLAQGHNAVTPVRLEPAAARSQVKHSKTDQLRSLNQRCIDVGLVCVCGWGVRACVCACMCMYVCFTFDDVRMLVWRYYYIRRCIMAELPKHGLCCFDVMSLLGTFRIRSLLSFLLSDGTKT